MTRTSRLFAVLITCTLSLTLFLVIVLALSLPLSASSAATIRYVAPGASCAGATPCYASVQAAVDAAQAGDEIRVAASTYSGVSARPRADVSAAGTVTQVVYVDTSVTIRGGYATADWSMSDPTSHETILDASDSGRVFYVTANNAVTLENLTITGGNANEQQGDPEPSIMDAGGGIYAFRSAITINNCLIHDNTASTAHLAFGGGLYLYESSATTLTNNTIRNNQASVSAYGGHGGGVGLVNSTATIDNNTIISNTAALYRMGFGGGMYVTGGTVSLADNSVRGNHGSTTLSSTYVGHGGGLLFEDADVTLTGNTIENNVGGMGGSSVGSFAGRGGGVHLANSDATVIGNTIANNVGSTGGSGSGGGSLFCRRRRRHSTQWIDIARQRHYCKRSQQQRFLLRRWPIR